jgi:hypothetical protein
VTAVRPDAAPVEIPRDKPWSWASSIHAARTVAPSSFELELQSGDTWRIRAAKWVYGEPLSDQARPA